ncbi:unnamed protein product [Paramecium sonneborni]|uniref:Uncharacterized protein n=1 Tax=Paramecium sonneborni TaxID=65129 RepID=A0A8S1PXL2_9CILI|nr:unnamed protein product [Paramecium sonneborni]
MHQNPSQYNSLMHLISNVAYKKAQNRHDLENLIGFRTFKSANQYQRKIFPLLQNEYYQSIQRDLRSCQRSLIERNSYPIVLKIKICENEYEGYKFKILEEIETKDKKNKLLWKYRHYADYLIFKESSQYIGAIYIQDPNNLEYFSSLAIINQKGENQYLLLPNNIALIFPVGIFDYITNVYFQPISPISAYQTEANILFQLENCPYYKLILQPIEDLNEIQPSDFAIKVREQQQYYFENETFKKQFNKEQLQAIYHSLNFKKRITIINGPPGTGKTQTIIGIISIMAELLDFEENKKKGAILILAKSNSVVNDLVRKINKNTQEKDSIIYCFDYKPEFLKVIRFGRPSLCDQDIAKLSLEIQAQNEFFQQFSQQIGEIEKLYITESIKQILQQKQLDNYQEYLEFTQQQITLISLLSYIEDLNRYSVNRIILNAYGNFYHQLSQFWKQNKDKYDKIEQQFLSQSHIIVSTLNSCTNQCLTQYFQNVNFRMCIVDEAPTALEPSLLIPLVKYTNIEKIVLLGDINQLSPIVVAKDSKNLGYNRSLFQRLSEGLNKSTFQLIYQYRQMNNLAEITSQLFYKNSLRNGNQIQQFPDWISQKVSYNRNRLFFSAPSQTETMVETSRKNDFECCAIVKLIKYLLHDLDIKNHQKGITIISGYSAQKHNLFKSLHNEIFQVKKDQKGYNKIIRLSDLIELDTVDSFQGKENDIIILSLVRSNKQAGFLTDKKRTNVALSRAKYCQYIFGTYQTMSRNLLNWNKVFKLLEPKNEIINYTQEDLDNPNFFEQTLKLE